MAIIKSKKSIIPSFDVDSLEKLGILVKETCNVKGIGAYKIGFELVLPFGMERVIKTIRKHSKLPIIYDHQKAGPETEAAWIKAAQKSKMPLIVGGEMTHKGYLKSENGFLDDDAPKRIYDIAASMGVTDFVIPGNKPEKSMQYVNIIKNKIKNPVFYSPGLISQGGSISDLAKKLDSWHAIIGRAIYEANDMKKVVRELAKEL